MNPSLAATACIVTAESPLLVGDLDGRQHHVVGGQPGLRPTSRPRAILPQQLTPAPKVRIDPDGGRVGLRLEVRDYVGGFKPLVGAGKSGTRNDVVIMAALRFDRHRASQD